MKIKELAEKIDAHLKRMEQGSIKQDFNQAQAKANGAFVRIHYKHWYWGGSSNLNRAKAEAYLEWLDAGNVGEHWMVPLDLVLAKQAQDAPIITLWSDVTLDSIQVYDDPKRSTYGPVENPNYKIDREDKNYHKSYREAVESYIGRWDYKRLQDLESVKRAEAKIAAGQRILESLKKTL